MTKKIVPIAIALIALAAIGGYVAWQKYSAPAPMTTQSTASQPQQASSLNEATNWKTYKNNQYGVEIKYPSDYKLLTAPNPNMEVQQAWVDDYLGFRPEGNILAVIEMPYSDEMYQNTDFSDAFIGISVANKTAADCGKLRANSPDKNLGTEKINGVIFTKIQTGGAGLSHQANAIDYSAYINNTCFTFATEIHTATGLEGIKLVDETIIFNTLHNLITTLKFNK